MENLILQKKIEIYSEFIELYSMAGSYNKSKIPELASKLFLFASNGVVQKYLELRGKNLDNEKDVNTTMKLCGEFVAEMRKDLLGDESHLGGADFWKLIINDWKSVDDIFIKQRNYALRIPK